MNSRKSISIALGVATLASLSMASSAWAGPGPRGDNRSYSNITGTNIWNSTAPIIDDDFPIDPALVAKVNQINTDAAARYQECIDAIVAAEQSVPSGAPRQYLRQDPRKPYPQACVDLETLRSEAASLRDQIKEIQEAAAARSAGTW